VTSMNTLFNCPLICRHNFFCDIRWSQNILSFPNSVWGNAFNDAPRRVPGRGASMNGFPNRVWEPEYEWIPKQSLGTRIKSDFLSCSFSLITRFIHDKPSSKRC
jgi:hypothetical protein